MLDLVFSIESCMMKTIFKRGIVIFSLFFVISLISMIVFAQDVPFPQALQWGPTELSSGSLSRFQSKNLQLENNSYAVGSIFVNPRGEKRHTIIYAINLDTGSMINKDSIPESCSGIEIAGNYAYVSVSNGLRIYNLEDEFSFIRTIETKEPGYNFYHLGNLLYVENPEEPNILIDMITLSKVNTLKGVDLSPGAVYYLLYPDYLIGQPVEFSIDVPRGPGILNLKNGKIIGVAPYSAPFAWDPTNGFLFLENYSTKYANYRDKLIFFDIKTGKAMIIIDKLKKGEIKGVSRYMPSPSQIGGYSKNFHCVLPQIKPNKYGYYTFIGNEWSYLIDKLGNIISTIPGKIFHEEEEYVFIKEKNNLLKAFFAKDGSFLWEQTLPRIQLQAGPFFAPERIFGLIKSGGRKDREDVIYQCDYKNGAIVNYTQFEGYDVRVISISPLILALRDRYLRNEEAIWSLAQYDPLKLPQSSIELAITYESRGYAEGGIKYEFECHVDDPLGRDPSIEWNFGDKKMLSAMASETIYHIYDEPNIYTVTAHATFNDGSNKNTSATVTCQLPQFTLTATPIAYTETGIKFEFRCHFDNPSEMIYQSVPTVHWDFRDNESEDVGAYKTVYHIYSTPGIYEVKANLTFHDGPTKEELVNADYKLPDFTLNATPAAGFSPLNVQFVCKPLLTNSTTRGLIFEWSFDGNNIIGTQGSTFLRKYILLYPYFENPEFYKYKSECTISDPNPSSGLSTKCEATVHLFSLPQPNGESIPFLNNCRGACGAGCPDTAKSLEDITIRIPDPLNDMFHYLLIYPGVKECGTHAACRWHDACFDQCKLWGEDSKIGPLHNLCSDKVVDRYGLIDGGTWMLGYGPYDGYFIFSNEPTLEGPFSRNDNSITLANYRIDVNTHSCAGAGTDANVYITLFGTDGSSSTETLLDNSGKNDFKIGMRDTFYVRLKNFEDINRIRLRHDNSLSISENVSLEDIISDDLIPNNLIPENISLEDIISDNLLPGWYVDEVRVINQGTGQLWHFITNRWLAEDKGDGRIDVEFPLSYKDERGYQIDVYTGDLDWELGEGTDANIYITLFGSNGFKTDEIYLDYPYQNNFEIIKTPDKFYFIRAGNVGELNRIVLRSDNSGILSDWYCEKIEVKEIKQSAYGEWYIPYTPTPSGWKETDTGRVWIIPVNAWLTEDNPTRTRYPQ